MNCIPKRWAHTGDLKSLGWYGDSEGIFMECEIVQPPSSSGRTIYVHIRGEEVEWLLKELRDVAIARRSQPMEGATQ